MSQTLNKFENPLRTVKNKTRAFVDLEAYKTVWFNTGSLCNIECKNCYIASSPKADHFVYLSPIDVAPYLDELEQLNPGPIEIAFTGGEPFMNPHIITLCEMVLERSHCLLVLSNAMKPLMRPRVQDGVRALQARYQDKFSVRVSLDHYAQALHDKERGQGSFKSAVTGLNWLNAQGVKLGIAGRMAFHEDFKQLPKSEQVPAIREAYKALIEQWGWKINPDNPLELMLFPEMGDQDVPEITTACWQVLGVNPKDMMCASSRMIVRRKGALRPTVLACTLLWDDPQFEMGASLKQAQARVQLNHASCAQFCVLGGASCTAS